MKIHRKNCLVTGGTGFVGSHLVDKLLAEGCKVTIIDDLSVSSKENIKHLSQNIKLVFLKKSVQDTKAIDEIFSKEKFDVVFHLAATNMTISIKYPTVDLLSNTLGTLNILQAIKRYSPRTVLVYSSTGSVYGEPIYSPQDEKHPLEPTSPYGISKLAAEKYVLLWNKLYNLKSVALRYYNIYGPRQNYLENSGVIGIFINRVHHGLNPIIEGTGKQQRCFTYVENVVNANILAAENQNAWGDVYNIASNQITDINNLAKVIIKVLKSDVEIEHSPRRLGEIDFFNPSIKKAQKKLKYKPLVNLEEGIDKTVQWFKETQW